MRWLVVTAVAAALVVSSLSSPVLAQGDRVPPSELAALRTRVYSVPPDVAFHATLATLQMLGFEDISASRDAGTISAVTDSKSKTILNFFWGFGKKKWTTKAQLLVEDYGGGSQVRLGLSQKETKSRGIFGTSFTDGETVSVAQPYHDFFAALDAEIARRGGAGATGAAVAKVDAAGNISVGDGIQLVPAKTLSGYCIKAPNGYMGTGATNSPAVTNARPICH